MIQHALRSAARAVLLLDESKKELLFELTNGKRHRPAEHIRLDAGSGIVGWVARNGKPLIINDTSKYRRFNKDIDQLAGYPSKSIICVPLIVRGKTIGVLEVLNKLDGSGFTEEDLATLVAVGSIAGMAIENTRLHRTVEEGYKSTIRALAVADVFDTMTTNRSYRSALDNSEALEELVRCSGTQFCPAAVDAFIAGFRQNAKNGLPPSPAFCPR